MNQSLWTVVQAWDLGPPLELEMVQLYLNQVHG